MTLQRGRQLAAAALFGVPSTVLVLSYGRLAVGHHTWNLFPVVVHENGVYTLLQTIFYFRHVVRELPINVFAAFAVAMAASVRSPVPSASVVDDRSADIWRQRLGWALLAFVALLLLIVSATLGPRETLTELAQYRTRDELWNYGSHWRYHLLHLIDTAFFVAGLAIVLRGLTGAGRTRPKIIRWWLAWILAFVCVTLVFGRSTEALTDPLNLAHQAREIETHRLLTILPALGVIGLLDSRIIQTPSGRVDRRAVVQGSAVIAGATLIPIWITYHLRNVDVLALAQQHSDLVTLAAAHHFEHVIDVGLMAIAAGWLYLLMVGHLRADQPNQQHATT